MATTCDLAAQEVGSGVAAALTAVDCIAGQVSEQAFGRLSEGPLAIVLPILLTFFVAFFGFRLVLGRSNLSIRALVPRILTVGLVVTFATRFEVFSTVFNTLFVWTPSSIAGILTSTEGAATVTFAKKLDVVFIAIQQASIGQDDINVFSPPGMMWLGALLLLLGTVGLLVTARIGLSLLLAVGPIFVVMALFTQTRGLFVGWLKGMVMLALVPIFSVVGGSIMLELAVPILATLVEGSGPAQTIDQQAAMAFFLVGFVHCMLMIMALIVSAMMVSRWQIFGFVSNEKDTDPASNYARTPPALQNPPVLNRAAQLAPAASATASQSRTDIAAATLAANDPGLANATVRETKVYASTSQDGQSSQSKPGASRTRGIGNRFKSASAHSARPKTEIR